MKNPRKEMGGEKRLPNWPATENGKTSIAERMENWAPVTMLELRACRRLMAGMPKTLFSCLIHNTAITLLFIFCRTWFCLWSISLYPPSAPAP